MTFDGFSLQDSNYIISDVVYRTIPERDVVMDPIARRPGTKLTSSEFGTRTITMRGYVLGSDSSNLQSLIDNLHTNVTRKKGGTLIIETGRSITALVRSIAVEDPHYTQSFVPIEIQFVCPNPFFYGAEQSLSWTIASGTASQQMTTTISGSVFAEPTISFTSNGSTGQTTLSGIKVLYDSTGETTTWSGTGATTTLAYGSAVAFNYAEQIITEDSVETEPAGVFPRWEPGSTTFTTTFSGTTQGGTLKIAYQPRYL